MRFTKERADFWLHRIARNSGYRLVWPYRIRLDDGTIAIRAQRRSEERHGGLKEWVIITDTEELPLMSKPKHGKGE
jgi:hypothetical protein